jgi:hypothetical protein
VWEDQSFKLRVSDQYIRSQAIIFRTREVITVKKDPIGNLKELVLNYTEVVFIPDVDHYRPVTGKKSGHCIFRGCTEPIAWEDAKGGNFLCEGHFRIMKQWVQEAREALVSGHNEKNRRDTV